MNTRDLIHFTQDQRLHHSFSTDLEDNFTVDQFKNIVSAKRFRLDCQFCIIGSLVFINFYIAYISVNIDFQTYFEKFMYIEDFDSITESLGILYYVPKAKKCWKKQGF